MSIIPKLEKPLEELTTFEQEQAKKRLMEEEEELLEEMGQESDLKALSTVREYVKETDDEKIETKNLDSEKLTSLLKSQKKYQRYLLVVLNRFLLEENITTRYHLTVDSGDKGIALFIDETGDYGAFRPCGIPKFDINACKMLAVQTGNTIALLQGNISSNKAGILLPSTAEAKITMREEAKKWKQ